MSKAVFSVQLRSKLIPPLAVWNMDDLEEGKETLKAPQMQTRPCHCEGVRGPGRAFIVSSPSDVKFIVDETLDFRGLSPYDRYGFFFPLACFPPAVPFLSLTPWVELLASGARVGN